MSRYSLAEIEAVARKAARGAGASWGIAEEAGHAVRWLEARGMRGTEAFVGLLEAQDGMDYTAMCPLDIHGVWQAHCGALCPIIAGVTLTDYRFAEPPTLGVVRFPILLLPFLAACGLAHPAPEEIPEADLSERPLQRADGAAPPASSESRAIADGVWHRLERYAHRTYVPATDASRAGAGAGTTDND